MAALDLRSIRCLPVGNGFGVISRHGYNIKRISPELLECTTAELRFQIRVNLFFSITDGKRHYLRDLEHAMSVLECLGR